MSISITVLVGRLTADPVLKKTQTGVSVVNFNLAVDRDIKKEGQPTADFITIQAWNKTADVIGKYCRKGNQIGIRGRIQTRNYDGTDGKKVYVTEVVAESVQFLESKGSANSNGNEQMGEYSQQVETSGTGYESMDASDIDSDDLPF